MMPLNQYRYVFLNAELWLSDTQIAVLHECLQQNCTLKALLHVLLVLVCHAANTLLTIYMTLKGILLDHDIG